MNTVGRAPAKLSASLHSFRPPRRKNGPPNARQSAASSRAGPARPAAARPAALARSCGARGGRVQLSGRVTAGPGRASRRNCRGRSTHEAVSLQLL